jgi:hypothetical protein
LDWVSAQNEPEEEKRIEDRIDQRESKKTQLHFKIRPHDGTQEPPHRPEPTQKGESEKRHKNPEYETEPTDAHSWLGRHNRLHGPELSHAIRPENQKEKLPVLGAKKESGYRIHVSSEHATLGLGQVRIYITFHRCSYSSRSVNSLNGPCLSAGVDTL